MVSKKEMHIAIAFQLWLRICC